MSQRNYKLDEPTNSISDLSSASSIDGEDGPIRMSYRSSTPIWKATPSAHEDNLMNSEDGSNPVRHSQSHISYSPSLSGFNDVKDDSFIFGDQTPGVPDARILSEKVVEPTFLTGITNVCANIFERFRRYLPEGLSDSSLARIHLFLCAFGLIALTLLIIFIIL